MSSAAFPLVRADADFRIHTYTLAFRPAKPTAVHATGSGSSSQKMAQTAESSALSHEKVLIVLEEVKQRHEEAFKEYMGFYER